MKDNMDNMNLSNIKPIRDIVYEYLRKAILDGNLNPGERIIENDFADKMNISRTPIREALRRLETEGFVEYIPRKGVVVKEFSLHDIEEIYAIRMSLESLAMSYVIKNITPEEISDLYRLTELMDKADKEEDKETVFITCQEFNEAILNASKMPRLTGMINTMHEQLEAFRRITMSKSSRRSNAISEHKEILQAIVDKDVKRAENLVWEHLESSKAAFFHTIGRSSD